MLIYLSELDSWWGPLRLFKYISFRATMAGATSLMIGFLLAPLILKRIKKLNLDQVFRSKEEVGHLATLHRKKQNTPTMGGFIIFFPLCISTLLWAEPNTFVLTSLLVYVCLTGLGFCDDLTKIRLKNSKGISAKKKFTVQAILTVSVLIGLSLINPDLYSRMQEMWMPFFKEPIFSEMSFVVVFSFLFIILSGSSNAINLTDGIDGLAIGCTISVALAYMIMAYASGNRIVSEYLFISYLPGSGELAILCSALLASGLVFLWYNSHPAEVFMGDTGSLALGGLLGCVSFLIHQPFTLVIVGGVFVMEALSVIFQVASFQSTGKRIFKMAPIHHHFELSGWHENKVVIRFWILSLIFAIAGLATLKLR